MKYYSNGKLFIIGEYYVLKGAKVLAIPTKYGQYLSVYPIQTSKISWKSYDADQSVWYNDDFSVQDVIENKKHQSDQLRNTLVEILHQAHIMNPKVLSTGGFVVETVLTFPRHWGLGTSSTLINNIAQWFEIDAFELLERSFGGSGYDIACAMHNSPIFYQKTKDKITITPANFYPSFSQHLYFVYLNKKKNSKEAISNFYNKQKDLTEKVVQVSNLAEQLIQVAQLEEFIEIMQQYEKELADILEIPTIQSQLFPDFKGLVKSLGGWGGDFVLVATSQNPTTYFQQKGYHTIIPYTEMILEK